jgi:hypothetical protein
MSEHRTVVPKGMFQAAKESFWMKTPESLEAALEAALRWLSENPIMPTREQASYMYDGHRGAHDETVQFCMTEWQRRMFLAPEAHQDRRKVDARGQ